MPANTVKVDRTTRWGNPFVIGELSPQGASVLVRDRAHAVELFRDWLRSTDPKAMTWRASLPTLRGKNLACWCALDGPCHADVLLALANDDRAH